MNRRISLATTVLFLAISAPLLWSQSLTQTVRGIILDTDTRQPLAGVEVMLPQTQPLVGTTTDERGSFRLEGVPVGRINLLLQYLGYEQQLVSDVIVNSGKEVVLQLSMQESAVQMNEVVVTANQQKGEAINEMALLSSRSISPEETNRYAGGFNDPSKILANFAGITSTQDGSNDIIVRGNSPKYVQWRLEGEQITNPNHFGDQSAVGGSISILNNTLLATSDFHTGAFAPEYGDALSGIYDVRLRAGNNEKFESTFSFGIIGTEINLEGPLKKGYDGSFLVNYRYSTASLIQELGLVDIDGTLSFQDATFKIVLPTRKAGLFSVYGLGGFSRLDFVDVSPKLWDLPGDNYTKAEQREDFQKKAHLLNLGLKHSVNTGKNSYLNTSFTYSSEGIEDDIFEARVFNFYDEEGVLLRDSVLNKNLRFDSDLEKPTWRASATFNHKFNSRHKVQVGTRYTLFDYTFRQTQFQGEDYNPIPLVDFQEQITTIRNFVSWKYRGGERFSLVAGLHNVNVLLNKKSTLEPRLSMEYKLSPRFTLGLGYGRHSSMESIHHYFAKVEQPDGSFAEVNRDLGLLKADHLVLSLQTKIGNAMRAKLEAYYQNLFDLPVENLDTSHFATIAEGLDFRYVDLVNAGKGKNYGLELTLEKFFSNQYYYLINVSVFESKYTPLDGIERNTPFNGNYLFNMLFGKEFNSLGKKDNQTLGINTRVFVGGGRKIIPLLRDTQGNLNVDVANNKYWDYSKAYETSIEDPYQIQVSMSYKWNKPRTTHEFFLNLENVTNNKGKISEYYDENEPGKIGYLSQFGFFPNILYRVYF